MAQSIALIVGDLGAGGAQRVVCNLASLWQGAGTQVTVITFSGLREDFFSLPAGVTRSVIGNGSPSRSVAEAVVQNLRRGLRLRRAIRDSGVTHVVSFIGSTNVLAVLACRGLPVRLAISERNDPSRQSLGRAWDFLRRVCYPRADVVTVNSNTALAALAATVPADKLHLVPNPVLPPDDIAPEPLPFRAILSVGRLVPQKGHDVLLRAFAYIAGRMPEWGLVILGQGELETDLRVLADDLGIGDRILWPSPTATPWGFYGAAEILAMPSRFEGTPNALLEGMAMGLAAVVTETSGGAREVVGEDAGLIVPTDEPEALAAALLRLASDDDLRRRVGAAARAHAASWGPLPVLAAWNRALGIH